jgi:hypothetical protein
MDLFAGLWLGSAAKNFAPTGHIKPPPPIFLSSHRALKQIFEYMRVA